MPDILRFLVRSHPSCSYRIILPEPIKTIGNIFLVLNCQRCISATQYPVIFSKILFVTIAHTCEKQGDDTEKDYFIDFCSQCNIESPRNLMSNLKV